MEILDTIEAWQIEVFDNVVIDNDPVTVKEKIDVGDTLFITAYSWSEDDTVTHIVSPFKEVSLWTDWDSGS